MKRTTVIGLKMAILLLVLFLLLPDMAMGKMDDQLFSAIKPRSIGPANMSGRIGDIDIVIARPEIIYVGAATGGVWKSENRGINWQPIFDSQSASSIGALRICQQNPNIVWVGTGEGNPRNSVGVGRGIFKSIDAGQTWTLMGLEKTEKIPRIVLDPYDTNVVYAAAMGTTWGETPERGVFKTTDGGRTWEKVLFVDQKTGAADLAMAPDNPNKLIAAMWEHRRWPWFFKSGGPGSGLFITTDGGKKWRKLTPKDGLPEGDLGRIGIAFAQNKPSIVYALVEAKRSVLLRSQDGGFTWKTVNDKPGVSGRPFYYSDIRVNPRNENIVYSLESRLRISEDGGKNFTELTDRNQAHADFQAMRIHPNGEYMVVGNDGGIVISVDRGKTWRFARNLPLGQFYHISYDMELPYNVYGGLQDNGSWRGPSTVLTDRGIFNYHWRSVGGGDGFDTEPDPENSSCGYAMSQGGRLFYFNVETGMQKNIRPTESDVQHRYNWNTGFAQDPFDPAVIYYGSQFVHRSPDRGQTWDIISPDLTTNDPEKQKQAESGGLTLDVTNAENHTTIMCIAPSPVKKDVIWVGTDDGNVQLTTDGGKNWQLVSDTLTGTKTKKGRVPYGTWVPHVEASKFNQACAFVVFDDHRRANWTPYIFVTEDYGKTWKSLVTKDIDGFVHVIEQDHVNKDLLFVGTEFGFYFSVNRGKNWEKWVSGFPTVPVRDIAVHSRDTDLIIGTHGRSIYIIDDISFLREIEPNLFKKTVHLFKPSDTYQFRTSRSSSYSTSGDTEFSGQNKEMGTFITYYLNLPEKKGIDKTTDNKEKEKTEGMQTKSKSEDKSTPKIEILNEKGNVIRTLKIKLQKGINRINWDLREKEIEIPGMSFGSRRFSRGSRGLYVLPGTYTVSLQYGDTKLQHPIQVKPDPRYKIEIEVLKKNYDLSRKVILMLSKVFGALKEIQQTQKSIKIVLDLIKDSEIKNKKELMADAKALDEKLKALSEEVRPDPNSQGISDRTASLSSKIFMVVMGVANNIDPLTQATEVQLKKTRELVKEFFDKYNKLYQADVEPFGKRVIESGVTLFKPFTPLGLKEDN